MTRKIFLLVFSFTFILAALSSDECYAQRFKKSGSTGRSGNTDRSVQKPKNNTSGKRSISGKEFNSSQDKKRDYSDVDKRNKDINE